MIVFPKQKADDVKFAGKKMRNRAIFVLQNEGEDKKWRGAECKNIKERIGMIRRLSNQTFPTFALAMKLRHCDDEQI